MRVIFILILTSLVFPFSSFSQNDTIPTEDIMTISLLTYSPLPEIYGAFGHSSIRIQNKVKGTDVIYNYGIFDYSEPNFTWKFLRGKLEYQLGKENTQRTFNYYSSTGGRQIWEQEMMLTPEEELAVYYFLENNYLPENRKYYYDFFFDNCATKIRDILEKILGDKLVYDEADVATDMTMRELLDVHVASRPWDDLGMDLLVGIPADKQASFREQMFLPGFLSENLFAAAKINRGASASKSERLLGAKKLVVDGDNYMNEPSIFSPFIVFGILCLFMSILTLIYTHNKYMAILDSVLFFILGIVGLILLFMWFGTDHDATQWNLNTLWANPLYLLFFIPIARLKQQGMKIAYGMSFVTGILILLGWGFSLPQHFHSGVLPIVLMMLVRSGSAFLYLKKQLSVNSYQ